MRGRREGKSGVVQYGTLTLISAVTDGVSESDVTTRKVRIYHSRGLLRFILCQISVITKLDAVLLR